MGTITTDRVKRPLAALLLVAALGAPAAALPDDPAAEAASEAAVPCTCSADCVRQIHYGSVCVEKR